MECWASGSSPATGWGSGARTAPSGSSSSTPRRRRVRSSSTSTPPTGPPSSSTCSTSPAAACSSPRATFKTSDYVAMVEEVRPSCPQLERDVFLDSPDWDELLGAARPCRRTRCASARGHCSSMTRSTSSTRAARPAFPRARRSSHHNILNNGFFVGRGAAATRREDRVCIPVPFYHCFGMVMGNLGCTTHGACMVVPAPAFEPARDARGGRRPSAAPPCTACRRCSSPSSTTRASATFDLSSLRTGIMAGSPCPVEVMRKVIERMHMQEVTICYGMTETSPVSTQTGADDTLERRVATVGRRAPARRGQDRRPGHGRAACRAASPASCAPAATA